MASLEDKDDFPMVGFARFNGITENKEDFVLVVFDEAREVSTCCFRDFDPE